jgi:hypothetical protein
MESRLRARCTAAVMMRVTNASLFLCSDATYCGAVNRQCKTTAQKHSAATRLFHGTGGDSCRLYVRAPLLKQALTAVEAADGIPAAVVKYKQMRSERGL